MKSKFEKELRKSAYDAVPYNFDEIKQKASGSGPVSLPGKPRYTALTAFTAVAAAFAVLAIAALGVRLVRSGRLNSAQEQTEEVTVVSDESVTYPESTQNETSADICYDGIGSESGATTAIPQSVYPAPSGEETTDIKTTVSSDGVATSTKPLSVKPAASGETKTAVMRQTVPAKDLTHGHGGASTTAVTRDETGPSMHYTYYINSGRYKNYCPGKVIEKDKVGEKIGSVTVTGYWEGFGAQAENKTQKETLSADVYGIKGVSDSVAVCLKFNDKGDALTTNHYYVVINPDADSSPVSQYIIGGKPQESTRPSDNSSDYVVGYTQSSAAYTIPE